MLGSILLLAIYGLVLYGAFLVHWVLGLLVLLITVYYIWNEMNNV